MKIIVPVKTVNEANCTEHWAVKGKRHGQQKLLVRSALNENKVPTQLPCLVCITRIAPRKLDEHDNLTISVKWICDAIAEYFIPGKATGRADDDKRLNFTYDQRRGKAKEYSLEIEFCYESVST